MPTSPVRVLVVAPFYLGPAHPYAGIFVHQQVLALRRTGQVAVEVQTFHAYAPRVLGLLRERWRQMSKAEPRYTLDGVDVVSAPVVMIPRNLSLDWTRRQMATAIRRRILELRPDVVHVHFAYPSGLAAVNEAHRASLPCVLTVHGSDVEQVPQLSPKYGSGVRKALREADCLIAASRALGKQCEAIATTRPLTLYTGLRRDPRDIPRAPVWGEGGVRLLFVGNLLPSKGVVELLDSLAFLSGVSLTFIGDGDLRQELARRAKEQGWHQRVSFLGRMNNDAVRQAMAEMDVLVAPSHREGLGMVVLEAFASRLPVVSTNVGGLKELIQDKVTGLVVEPHNPAAIARAIEWLRDHPEERARMVNAAEQLLDRSFDLDRNAVRLHGIYRDLVDRRRT